MIMSGSKKIEDEEAISWYNQMYLINDKEFYGGE